MAVFDSNNPPTIPDSTLDSDLTSELNFTIEDSTIQPIALGDWVDVDPSALDPDPNWGYSFQVVGLNPSPYPAAQSVNILMYTGLDGDGNPTYESVALSTAYWIQNNFRRVPRAT